MSNILLRLTAKEKKAIDKLAKNSASSVSDYIKRKLFEDNPDFLLGDKKFISPSSSVRDYAFAHTLTKTLLFVEYFLSSQLKTKDEEFKQLKAQIDSVSRERLQRTGFRKIEESPYE